MSEVGALAAWARQRDQAGGAGPRARHDRGGVLRCRPGAGPGASGAAGDHPLEAQLVTGRLFRRELRARAQACLTGMLPGLERRPAWSLAERASEKPPDGMRRQPQARKTSAACSPPCASPPGEQHARRRSRWRHRQQHRARTAPTSDNARKITKCGWSTKPMNLLGCSVLHVKSVRDHTVISPVTRATARAGWPFSFCIAAMAVTGHLSQRAGASVLFACQISSRSSRPAVASLPPGSTVMASIQLRWVPSSCGPIPGLAGSQTRIRPPSKRPAVASFPPGSTAIASTQPSCLPSSRGPVPGLAGSHTKVRPP